MVAPISFKAAIVLLICVPLIPVSIIAVMKFAKKLLGKYWGIYTNLGDSFLENLHGLTTLKIYDLDEQKNEEMNKEAEVAHTDLTSAKSETADLILSAKDIAEHLSSHSAKVVGLSNLLDNNKIKEILAENI